MTTNEKALQMHEQWNGKLETTAKAHVNSEKILQSHIHLALPSHVKSSQKNKRQSINIL